MASEESLTIELEDDMKRKKVQEDVRIQKEGGCL